MCICGAASALLKYEEEHKLINFLMGMNESYTAVRGSILMIKPLPSLDEAYSMLMEEETQISIQTNTQI